MNVLYQRALAEFGQTRTNKRKREIWIGRACSVGVEQTTLRGDRIADAVLSTLDRFEGLERTQSQRRFHKAFFAACLPHIYGAVEFAARRERILRKYDVAEFRPEILVCTPRRWGKTYAVAMFVAALLYCVPEMWISCYSTGQRASSALLELSKKLLSGLRPEPRIAKCNQEELFLTGDGEERRFFSYPSSVKGD